jgi:hypothetical protein
MGSSLAWLAVKNISFDDLLRNLKVTATAYATAPGISELVGQTTRDGWCLLIANRCDSWLVSPLTLEGLPPEAVAIACSVEEHVMWSCAEAWVDRRKAWQVAHSGESGKRHLDAVGILPSSFAALSAEAERRQAASDLAGDDIDHYFDIPLHLSYELAGFRHDEPCRSVVEDNFALMRTAIDRSDSEPKRWWNLFGRR